MKMKSYVITHDIMICLVAGFVGDGEESCETACLHCKLDLDLQRTAILLKTKYSTEIKEGINSFLKVSSIGSPRYTE